MKLAIKLIFLSSIALASGTQAATSSNGWLTGEQDESTRLKKLEKYLRGFDQPMLETGQRFESIYQAISDKNYDLAVYQWKKVRTTIENGLMKRPKREKNAKLLLLDSVWADVLQDFKSKDEKRAQFGFTKAKAACMSCHLAENKGFINGQPMFKLGDKQWLTKK